jgi:hypothetical protein
MRYYRTLIWAAVGLVLLAWAPAMALAGDHDYCPPPDGHFLQRFHPVGGWNPGGGLLHWWNPRCFPRWCGPDDYCRKPPPNVCRPGCWTCPPLVAPMPPR